MRELVLRGAGQIRREPQLSGEEKHNHLLDVAQKIGNKKWSCNPFKKIAVGALVEQRARETAEKEKAEKEAKEKAEAEAKAAAETKPTSKAGKKGKKGKKKGRKG